MIPTPALPVIPQRPPFVLVDNILECDEEIVVTDFLIEPDHLLVHNGHITPTGLLENIAQTCATRIGWLNRDKPVRIGVIGSVNNFEYTKLPEVGQQLITTVTLISSVFEAIIVHADIHCNDQHIAQCEMKVFVTDRHM